MYSSCRILMVERIRNPHPVRIASWMVNDLSVVQMLHGEGGGQVKRYFDRSIRIHNQLRICHKL